MATRVSVGVALLLAIATGAFMAVQARLNGELATVIGDGFSAATISFGSGLVILCVILAFSARGRRGLVLVRDSVRGGKLPWWSVLGGAAGAFLVLTQSLTVAIIGVALFSVAVVAGQTISGLLMDVWGMGPSGKAPVTINRLAGAILAIVAVGFTVASELGGPLPMLLLIMPFIAGFGIGWQQAVNGRVRVTADSVLTATLINFIVGTGILVIATIVHTLVSGGPSAVATNPILYLGGAMGCVFIGLAAFLVPHVGTLVLSLGMVAGQLMSSVVLDLFLAADGVRVTPATVIGALVALVAVGLAALPRIGRPKTALTAADAAPRRRRR